MLAPPDSSAFSPPSLCDVLWQVADGAIEYPVASAYMEHRAAAIRDDAAAELVWLVEHPPLYTAGTSADPAELVDPRFPVFASGRGGRYTYHGPGQRVGYLMLDLARRGRDVRGFVHALENWVIAALARLGVECWTVPGRVGIWTSDGGGEAKIGAIGIRIRRWVTMHGFAVNLNPDLGDFGGIIPCGIADRGVTSLEQLGKPSDFETFDAALALEFPNFIRSLKCA